MTSSSPGSSAGPDAPPPAPISPALDFFAGTVAGPPRLLSPPTCTLHKLMRLVSWPVNRHSEPRDGPSVRHRCVHTLRHALALQDGVLTAVSLPRLDVGSSSLSISRAQSKSAFRLNHEHLRQRPVEGLYEARTGCITGTPGMRSSGLCGRKGCVLDAPLTLVRSASCGEGTADAR
jgi:hypothetical protein